ncbi:MAG: DNA alkylation repair protein [Acidobacteria bacterium]|nr:DNA alkylation repair protein [Acidobacteriota bacterium]
MPTSARRTGAKTAATIDERVRAVLEALKKSATTRDYANLERFGITAANALGVSMANVQKIAKPLGRSHELALALWETGVYEARMLTAFVDDPAQVTAAQMDRWCRDFDNWGICDTLCFKLFDQTPHAWRMVATWAKRKNEHEKRAAFALLASLAGHDKLATNAQFLGGLDLVERAATDERNFVKKGVSWALRRIGGRNAILNAEASKLARRLADSSDATARWIGKDALREFDRSAHKTRVSRASK